MSVIHGNSSNFDSLVNSGVVVVDFFADSMFAGVC